MIRRMLPALAAVALVALWVSPSFAGKVEVKGIHICCKQCVSAVEGVLGKVDGVSDAKADQAGKTATFTSKDAASTKAALSALTEAGFFGTVTEDGKEVKVEVASPKKGDKADEITLKNVHVCCNQCKKALTGMFKEQKVEFPGKNDIKIIGKDLDKAEIVETLRK